MDRTTIWVPKQICRWGGRWKRSAIHTQDDEGPTNISLLAEPALAGMLEIQKRRPEEEQRVGHLSTQLVRQMGLKIDHNVEQSEQGGKPAATPAIRELGLVQRAEFSGDTNQTATENLLRIGLAMPITPIPADTFIVNTIHTNQDFAKCPDLVHVHMAE
ncbi:hypothetical protein [Candidatus Aalborgicola defluviihabitans]|uniref:hypothetical protein n=1 Tax=Candidatus Aalborgicola defluviihabitans TaxID=3386187 RepID=UPI0039B88529